MKPNKQYLFLAILILLSVKLYSIPDTALSVLYTRYAIIALHQDDMALALEHCQKAEEFGGVISDCLYIKGMEQLEKEDFQQALLMFEEALDSASWLILEPEICSQKILPLYFRFGQYEKIIETFNLYYYAFQESEEFSCLYLESLIRTSHYHAAFLQAAHLNRIHPYSMRIIFLEWLARPDGQRLRARLRGSSYSLISRYEAETLLSFIPENKPAVEDMSSLFSFDGIELDLLQHRIVRPFNYFSLIKQPPVMFNYNTLQNLLARRNPFITAALINMAKNYSGTIVVDSNYDRYPEAKLVVDQGQIQSIYFDGNQDGESDWVVFFKGGTPDSVLVNSSYGRIQIRYSNYPYLDYIERSFSQDLEIYTFMPSTEPYPLDFCGVKNGNIAEYFSLTEDMLFKSFQFPEKQFFINGIYFVQLFHETELLRSWTISQQKDIIMTQTSGNNRRAQSVLIHGNNIKRILSDYDGDTDLEILEVHHQDRRSFYFNETGFSLMQNEPSDVDEEIEDSIQVEGYLPFFLR